MTSFARDLRFALRSLARDRGFTVVAVATFALAIAATSAMFTVVNEVLFRPLPFPHEEQLVRLQNADVSDDGQRVRFNMRGAQVELIRRQSAAVADVVGLQGTTGILQSGGDPRSVSIVAVGPGWTETLAVAPVVGRVFTPAEHQGRGAGRPAIISHALWIERFGGRADVTRQAITIDGAPFDVVGVFPAGFRFPYSGDVWLPVPDGRLQDAAVFARLQPGVTIDEARAALATTMSAQRTVLPVLSARARLAVTPARDSFIGDEARVALALLGLTGAFLLIGVGNLGNLLLARGLARRRDMAVRAALGATGWHQLRAALAETLLLVLAGAGLGLVGAAWASAPLRALVPDNFVRELHATSGGIDLRVVAFTFTLAGLVGIVTAAVPTWSARRADPRDALAEGARGSSPGTHRLRLAFAGGGIALSLAVLACAAALAQHLAALRSAPLGIAREGVQTFQVQLPARSTGPAERLRFLDDAAPALAAVPGVGHAGFISANPLAGGTWTAPVVAEGQSVNGSDAAHLVVNHRLVTPGVLDALGIRVLQGRGISRADGPSTAAVALVSHALARRLWPDGQAVGRRLRVAVPGADWIEVVGVVSDVRDAGDVHLTWYLPYSQHGGSGAASVLVAMVRGRDGVTPPLPSLADAVHRAAPGAALYDATPLAAVFDETIVRDRLGAQVAAGLGALGLFMAMLGLYGIVRFLVGERRLELAIRMALGATDCAVVGLMVRHVGVVVALGVGAGWLGGATLVRLAQAAIPDLPAGTLLSYLMPTAILVAAAAGAVWSATSRIRARSLADDLRDG